MRVENNIVYRVVPDTELYAIGQCILPSQQDYCGEHKERVEKALQDSKPIQYPSRKDCLFVCFSKENANEWALLKWRANKKYKLLTLSVTGEIFWFMAEHYNRCPSSCSDEMLSEAANKYWNSCKNNNNSLTIDHEYEGIFVGRAEIIDIEIMMSYCM